MIICDAQPQDIPEISRFLTQLETLGKRTIPSDEIYVRTQYIEHPDKILCSVAQDNDGALLGLQILKHATPRNIYDVTPGWGIIGTHVRADCARRGVGKALFAVTRIAAKNAGLQKIDATIGAKNPEGLGYYHAMGFRTYQTEPGRIRKCFALTA